MILKSAPETMVLMLSMHSENLLSFVHAWRRARAAICSKMQWTWNWRKPSSGSPAGRSGTGSAAGKLSQDTGESRPALTTRELEVLQLIVHGKSSKEIAAILGISANTVAVHRANMMQTLGIHNTAELVVYAIRNGLANIS